MSRNERDELATDNNNLRKSLPIEKRCCQPSTVQALWYEPPHRFSQQILIPIPPGQREMRDDRDFDSHPTCSLLLPSDYYDHRNMTLPPPPKDRGRDFKCRRSPSPSHRNTSTLPKNMEMEVRS